MEASKVENTLSGRGAVYGDYKGGLKFRRDILHLISARYEEVNNKPIPQEQEQYFLDVIGKMSRLAVSPEHTDSWHDLAGYALLIEKVLNGEPT